MHLAFRIVAPLLALGVGTLARAEESSPGDAAPLPVAVAPSDLLLRYIGRFDTADAAGPRCSWSASRVVLRFTGSSLNARLGDSGNSDMYQVILDGMPGAALKLKAGTHLYRVVQGMAPGAHTVELVKRTEGFFGVSQFHGFQLARGGKLLALPLRSRHRIEVIGDSISCGYGNEAKDQKEHFSFETENAYQTYGSLAARNFGAEYVCVAWSGRKMWPDNTVDEVYGRTLASDANSRWDFARWTPDVVVICLGTNDFNGTTPDKNGWIAGYRAFLARVRTHYPKAAIYCATSPMMWGDPATVIRGYLDTLVRQENVAGHTNVRLLPFATQDAGDGFGANWHPSIVTHKKRAAVLTAALQKDLHWK